MSNFAGRSIIVTFVAGISHYFNLSGEITHSYLSGSLPLDWENRIEFASNLALPFIVVPLIWQCIYWTARFSLTISNSVIKAQEWANRAYLKALNLFEVWAVGKMGELFQDAADRLKVAAKKIAERPPDDDTSGEAKLP